MKYNNKRDREINGALEIFISCEEIETNGILEKHEEVLIHGGPSGLKSFAKLLLKIAELNQEEVDDKFLPTGASEHFQLRPGIELSRSSITAIVGRLDAKGLKQ